MRESGDIDVVGELDYGRVLAMTEPAADMKVDVIVIAHRLVIEYGVAIVPMLRDVFGSCGVLVHGEADNLELIAKLYAAGARGYFTLSTPPGQLSKAVKIVSEGKFWGPREAMALLAQQVLDEQVNGKEEEFDAQERQLLELLNEGLGNKEIGQRLGLAEPTIKARFNRLYKRFGVTSRLQLLSAAISRGLVLPR